MVRLAEALERNIFVPVNTKAQRSAPLAALPVRRRIVENSTKNKS